ncbi:class I SAM-dependent RNA methyltransferase [Sphingomicrobium marinum]|uniref:class I SAM-dependent RNA methyltransferase n=1 Tax=Sphingomicrobium marinum TaxID=1227950 RepID=UPI00223EAD83|nr:class I SAM-dependent RNA methyltransferase [Sphingomicrobium marinum]
MSEEIVRIAARGDGITSSGKFVAGTAPGDTVDNGKLLAKGPHHQNPPCRHFPQCGGCQLQHLDDEAYAAFCEDRIRYALTQKDLVTTIRPAHLSPPRSRRRASLKAARVGKRIAIGFSESRSHRIIDMTECHILRPELLALLEPMRQLLGGPLDMGRTAAIQMTMVDQGIDLTIAGVEAHGLQAAEALPAFAGAHRLARLSLDEGLGPEPRYEPRPVTITLSGNAVAFPSGNFLQATEDGEAALVAAAQEAACEGPILDLFAGLGTFSFALVDQGDVTAAEADRSAILSLMAAAKRTSGTIAAQHRDLYRNPYQADELAPYRTVVLDPPRSGAQAQCETLARGGPANIAYVSCNPDTFARDAQVLVAGGYTLEWVQPVGQFRWSTHVELCAAFTR